MYFPKTLTVPVTQTHIDRGRPRNDLHCPIAIAIAEHFGSTPAADTADLNTNGPHARVTQYNIRLYDSEHELLRPVRYALTPEAVNFIDRFDTHHPVEPFTLVAERLEE